MKNKKKHFVFITNLLAFSIVAPIAASFLLNLQNGSKSNLSNSTSNATTFDSEVIPGVRMHVETYYDSSALQTVAKITGLVNKDAIPDKTIFSFPATVQDPSGKSYPLFGIGDGAFNNVHLSKTKCGGLTFKDATNLRFIDPNAFNSFGNFQESNIVTVFPSSITKFGTGSFQNCPLLTIEFTEKDPRKITFGNAWKPNIESGKGYKISVPYSADESIVNAYVIRTSFSKGEFLNGYYPTTLTISPKVMEVTAGDSINVSAKYNDLGVTVDPDSKIWWDSSDSSSVVIGSKINKSNDPNTITFNQPGTYTITANYTIDSHNKLLPRDSFIVTVKRPDVSGIDVTTPSNQQIRISDSTDFSFSAVVQPSTYYPDAKVTWSWATGEIPELSLDPATGVVSYSPTASSKLSEGTYSFSLTATSVDNPTVSKTSDVVQLVVKKDYVTSLTVDPISDIDVIQTKPSTTPVTPTATVEPSTADQGVVWSLKEGVGTTTLPTWLTCDPVTGDIAWTATTKDDIGTYNIILVATSVGEMDSTGAKKVIETPFVVNVKYDDPTSITLSEGQTTLSGYASNAGAATSAFKATITPAEAKQEVTWALDNAPNWLSVNNGLISWSNLATKGTYNFTVKATAVDDPTVIATSDPITLTIDFNHVQSVAKPTGPTSLDGFHNEAKRAATPFTTTVDPLDANQDVTWSLIGAPSWVSIDADGYISWTNDAQEGTYNFTVKATSVGLDVDGNTVDSPESEAVTLTIKYAQPTSITITDGQYTGGNKAGIAGSLAAFKAKVLPDNAKQSVEWSLTDKSANFPSWITINSSTGVISWTDQCKKGAYSCNVKAKTTDADYPSIEATTDQTVNLTFTYADVTDIVITTPTDFPTTDWVKGHSITTSSFTAVVQPDGFADPNVTWSIKTSEGSQELSGLTIDPNTGILTWDGTGEPGTYKFKVVATSNGTQSTGAHYVKETSEFVVNVVYDKPTSITINDGPTVAGQGGKGRWGKSNNHYTAVVETKEHVAQDVNWSLVDFKKDAAAEPVPTWLHISQGGESVPEISDDPLPAGLIYWDNNCINGTYSVKVKVTAVEKSSTGTDVSATTTTDYNFVIDEATVDAIQLVDGTGLYTQTGTAGIAGTQLDPGFKAKTTYSDGTSDENTATWSITDFKKDGQTFPKPAWLNITPDASGVAKVNWTNASEKGVYTFNIVATAAKDLNKNAKTTTPVTLTIDYAFVGDVLLTDTTVQENNESIIGSSGQLSDKFKATVNPKDGIGTIEPGVTWKIEMNDGSQVPSWLHIDPEGLVTWDNNAPIGDYAFHVVATSVGKMESGQQAVSNPSKTIKLKVKYADVANITISGGSGPSITSEINKSGSTDPYIATVNPVGTTLQDVTWKIETKDGSPLPDWIFIDQNGKVSWTEHSNTGKYEFVIKAYANQEGSTSIFGEQDLTLIFNDIPVPPTPPKPEPTDNYDITRWIQIGLGLGIPTLIFGYTACHYIRISRRNNKNLINAIETKSPIVHRPQKTEEEKRQEQKLKEEKAEQQRIKQQEAEQQRIKAEEERIKAEQERIKAEQEKIKQQERLKQQEAEEKEIKNLSDEAKERDEKSNKTNKL